MIDNDKWCATWEFAHQQHCNAKVYWESNKFCQYSCFVQGVGYEGDDCCLDKLLTVTARVWEGSPGPDRRLVETV